MGKTKYIDAERFVDYFGDWYTEEGTEIGYVGPIKELVFRMPAADVVEVVRCKDCQYWNKGSCECPEHAVNCQDYWVGDIETEAEHFCGYAERREDE